MIIITYSNIFIDDSTKGQTRMIYAKNGTIIDDNNIKFLNFLVEK